METRTKKYMDELKIAKWKNYNQYANNHVKSKWPKHTNKKMRSDLP